MGNATDLWRDGQLFHRAVGPVINRGLKGPFFVAHGRRFFCGDTRAWFLGRLPVGYNGSFTHLMRRSRFSIIEGCGLSPSGTKADTVVVNATIYTDGTSSSRVGAFAISEGRFTFVGDNEGAMELVGDGTTLLDLAGKAILPGLIDAHVHPWQGGEKVLYMCNFDFGTTPQQLAETIGACASSPDAPEWIVGGNGIVISL